MKAFVGGVLVAVLLSHGAVEALADGGLVLSIGQMLSCLPVSAALCLPLCWTQQVEFARVPGGALRAIPPQADARLAPCVFAV